MEVKGAVGQINNSNNTEMRKRADGCWLTHKQNRTSRGLTELLQLFSKRKRQNGERKQGLSFCSNLKKTKST